MESLSFDDYFYEVWDRVDIYVVPNKVFDKNQEFIREVTFSFWNVYSNTYREENGRYTSDLSVNRCANILTSIFLAYKNIGFKY